MYKLIARNEMKSYPWETWETLSREQAWEKVKELQSQARYTRLIVEKQGVRVWTWDRPAPAPSEWTDPWPHLGQ